MEIEKKILVSKKLEKIADDFLREYKTIELKEINVVFTDFHISNELIKEISKKYTNVYFYSLHMDKERDNYLGSIISEEKLILK